MPDVQDSYVSRPEPEWAGTAHDVDEQPLQPRHEDPVDAEVEHTDGPESFSISQANQDLIRKALEKYNGNRKKAAEELGISERTLYRKLPPEFRSAKKADE